MPTEIGKGVITIEADAKGLNASIQAQIATPLKNAQAAADAAQASITSVGTAGQQVAAKMIADGNRIQTELAAQRSAAQALATAMGPELVAAYEASGQSTMELVADMKNLGLSAKDVEADSQALAGALGSLKDNAVSIKGASLQAEALGGSVKGVATETTKTGRVMGQFGADAVRQLTMATGATGSLTSALAQTANYATVGGVSLAAMGGAAVGIAGLSFVMDKFAESEKKAAAIRVFDAKQVEDYKKAIESIDLTGGGNAKTAAQTLVEQLKQSGKVEAVPLFGDSIRDIVPDLAKAGVSIQQYAELVTHGTDSYYKFKAAQQAAGKDMEATQRIIDAAGGSHEQYVAALERERLEIEAGIRVSPVAAAAADKEAAAAQHSRNVHDARRQAILDDNRATYDSGPLADQAAAAYRREAAAEDVLAAAHDRATNAIKTQLGIALDHVAAVKEADRAQAAARDAVTEYNAVLKNHKSTLADVDNATRNAADAIENQAQADARAAGAVDGSRKSVDLQIQSLAKQADSLKPGSPLRNALEQYIALLDQVPKDIVTNLVIHGADNPVLGRIATDKNKSGSAHAAGGYANESGPSLVGEFGPEIAWMNRGQYVTTKRETEQLLAGMTTAQMKPASASNVDVRVFIGERELTDIVDVRVQHNSQLEAGKVLAGVR